MHLTSQDIIHFDQIIAKACIDKPLVAVYCGSRTGKHEAYTQVAYQLGERLADSQLGLVYGGACIGVMGAVADGVLSKNGTAVGVIPTFLLGKELAHQGLSHLYTTDTMHTRKALMAEFASAFVVLAGGLGTLEEIMEIATWRQLYQHDKPMIIVNTNNFYDKLLEHLTHTVREGFMTAADLDRLIVCQTLDEVMMNLHPIVQMCDEVDVEKF